MPFLILDEQPQGGGTPQAQIFARLRPTQLTTLENPPSDFTQLLANGLPPWTAARTYGLPAGPLSLTAVSQNTYDPTLHGSHYQRFANAFAIELELLSQACDHATYGNFLAWPGYTFEALDQIWQVPLSNIPVTGVQANLTAKHGPSLLPTGQFALNPKRSMDFSLLAAPDLFTFYYGLPIEQTFNGNGPYVLSQRAGLDTDGTVHVEWVSVNGVLSAFTIGSDRRTITLTQPPGNLATVIIHYTTYDIYYQLPDFTTLYVREPAFELAITSSNSTTPIIATPSLFMVWNPLDELGLILAVPRHSGESNAVYARRLGDAVYFPAGPTKTGLRNALANELGLVHHVLWGPEAASVTGLPSIAMTTGALAIGNSSVNSDSILIDGLGLPYYSIITRQGAADTITLALPSLAAGASQTLTVQLMATGGPVVPTAVPLTVSTTVDPHQLGVYDAITIQTRPQTLFSAPTTPWIPGSLRVYKNGVALLPGVDFIEQSSTAFSLTNQATVGDTLQLGYIYPDSVSPPDLEFQPDIETDLAAVLRISAGVQVDATYSPNLNFPEWIGTPPTLDVANIPAYGTWSMTFTVTNAGSAPSTAATISVKLPPQITWDGQHLVIGRQDVTHDLRYIDDGEVWVRNLSDAQLQAQLYTASGTATPLLKAFAREISQSSPLEFGQVLWDRSIWRTISERASGIGFIPQQYDPSYNRLSARSLIYSGQLTGSGTPIDPTQASTSIIGLLSMDPASSPFTVGLAPGATIGATAVTRYPDFRSGIGFDDDLATSYATQAQLVANTTVPQRPLSGINPNALVSSLPASGAAMWLVTINPGTYYLNQEEHYLFSNPVYAETVTSTTFLEKRQPNTRVMAYRYDQADGLTALRLAGFTDAQGNPTLTVTETLMPSNNALTLSYDDIGNFTIISAADGLIYAPADITDNIVSFAACSTELTVSYTLNNSFMLLDADNGTWFVMDQVQPDGVLIIYEGGSGPMVTGLPLHPYYNPRTQGFLYLSADLYLPSKIHVWVDPGSVPANGITTFNTKVLVTDDYGCGVSGMPVNILVDYREGALSVVAQTDMFGYCTVDIPAQSSVQVAKVTASVQLFDAAGTPLPALLGNTYIELFSSYT